MLEIEKDFVKPLLKNYFVLPQFSDVNTLESEFRCRGGLDKMFAHWHAAADVQLSHLVFICTENIYRLLK